MKGGTGTMAPVTPSHIDEEINKHLALVADLRAQKNSSFPTLHQIREAAATKRTVRPTAGETRAESSGSFKMSVLLEPLDELNPKKAAGEGTVKSSGPKERLETRMSAKRKRPAAEPEEEEEEDPDAIEHNPPCDLCAKANNPCRGVPDRTCFRCSKQKTRCNKSRGRGVRGSGSTMKAPVPDTKGKVPVRASNSTQEPAEISLDLIAIDDDESPRKKTEAAPSNMVADTKRAILAIESKILTTRGHLKDLQARVSATEDLVTSMELDLDRVKSFLGN